MEAFYRRGLLDQLAAQRSAAATGVGLPRPAAISGAAQRSGPAGHFASIQFDYSNIDASRWTYRLPGPAEAQLGSAMEDIECVLAEHALAVGVEIQRGQALNGIQASADDVIVRAGERHHRGRWLVGCDGGRSSVRKLAGFDYAPDGLLDSYTAERHPIGARILDWTRAQVLLLRPNPFSRALADIVRDLINTRDGASYFAERVWGATLRYELGEAHPLVGRSCPDFELDDGSRLGEWLRDGRGVLLDFDAQASLRALDGAWGDRVRLVSRGAKDRLGLRALLVRPDGVVAWATDTPPDVEALQRAAAKWFASVAT